MLCETSVLDITCRFRGVIFTSSEQTSLQSRITRSKYAKDSLTLQFNRDQALIYRTSLETDFRSQRGEETVRGCSASMNEIYFLFYNNLFNEQQRKHFFFWVICFYSSSQIVLQGRRTRTSRGPQTDHDQASQRLLQIAACFHLRL